MSSQLPRHGISLRQTLPEAAWRGGEDLCVTSCSTDCELCRPGDLFVALAEHEAQREQQIARAASRGAVGVVTSGAAADPGLPTCLVADPREALGRICQALAGSPSRRLNVIGITGSRGKTTTSHLIAGVLAAGDYRAGLLGSLACSDGGDCGTAPRGTPTAPYLAQWLGRSAANGCTHAVMEISSRSLEESRIAGISLDMACVTNVRHEVGAGGIPLSDHAATAKIFEHLPPEGIAVLNADDERTHELLGLIDTPALTIGLRQPAEISATLVEQTLSDQTFLLSAGSETMPVRTPLLGTHNVYNCLFAAAVGFGYGLDVGTIARGLESIQYVTGRLERIECGQPFGVFVDHAGTPELLSVALRTLREVTRGRLACVFSPRAELDRFARVRLGRVVDELTDQAILTGEAATPSASAKAATKNQHGFAEDVLDDVLVGVRRRGRVRTIADRRQAIRSMLLSVDEGDCVLVAGGLSDGTTTDSMSRAADADVARHCLYDLAPAAVARRAVA
jgi:UDP-N-acetylmuramoyl-L-alanyl-D-glutamate--2,6-diaminopimelate ligase